MMTSRTTFALAVCLPLVAGALSGCGGDTAQPASTASSGADRQAAGGFTMASQSELTLATSKYSSSDWEAGGSPVLINRLTLPSNQPVTVPLRSRGGKEATFVLTVGKERTKVKVKGSTCLGFDAPWYSGYSPERGIAGMRISCAGEGFTLRGTNQF